MELEVSVPALDIVQLDEMAADHTLAHLVQSAAVAAELLEPMAEPADQAEGIAVLESQAKETMAEPLTVVRLEAAEAAQVE